MKKIHVLTGPVHTGKTTRLMQWASSQKNIDGIFQPIIDEKRFIYHIASRTLKMLESPLNSIDEKVIKIGNYRFSKDVFIWVQNVLLNSLDKNLEWLIIDEIGPLELEGKGLEPAVSIILNEDEKYEGNILCVVRDSMLDKFIEHYKLQSKFQLFELH
jgi:nucleoside-triphosphatase THEP1